MNRAGTAPRSCHSATEFCQITTNDASGGLLGGEAVGSRRLAGPALEGAREAALFGKARQEGDFGQAVIGLAQQLAGEFAACRIDRGLERLPLIGQPQRVVI